jgi:ferrous iron transport protein B
MPLPKHRRPLTAALLGNPNCGKSTLFNRLTGLRQRVGNWAGVTVERQEGQFCTAQYQIMLVDLPGIYSLTTPCPQVALDEQIACHYLCSGAADLVINVLDATDLARSLYLTVQLLERGVPCLIVLTRFDSALACGMALEVVQQLSERLAVPVIPVIATHAQGVQPLYQAIDDHTRQVTICPVTYPAAIEQRLLPIIQQLPKQPSCHQARWLALQLLEGDRSGGEPSAPLATLLNDTQRAVQQELGEEAALLIADARYATIARVCAGMEPPSGGAHIFMHRLDSILLNRWLGIPLFLGVLYAMFFLSIRLGEALQPLFERSSALLFIQGILWLGGSLGLPQGLTHLLAHGVGGGMNTLMPLIPQIALLYLFLGLLEDSGYLARAAFVMDRFMQGLGLPGKACAPLIIGFGCNVPSILGTRTLNGERERLLTILIAPFMTCSARLAIFVVFSATFFGRLGVFPLFSLYLLGISVAIGTGLLLKRTLLQGDSAPFVMELPLYQRPALSVVGVQIWHRLKGFIWGAGKLIILVNLVIGGLQTRTITGARVTAEQPVSALESVGQRLTPLLKPLGIQAENWPATVGLLTGIIAKEVVLGTLDTLYRAEERLYVPREVTQLTLLSELQQALQQMEQRLLTLFKLDRSVNLEKVVVVEESSHDQCMTPLSRSVLATRFATPVAAYSYLIFVLLYIPCVSTLGAIGRESGWRWMWFSLFWGVNVAYSLATLYYQSVTWSQHPQQSCYTMGAILLFNALLFVLLSRWRPQQSAQRPAGRLLTEKKGV